MAGLIDEAHAGHGKLLRARYASAGDALAGIWLMASPLALDFRGSDAAWGNHVIVGAAVLILAAIRAFDPDEREGISWVNVILGLWMIVAPFVLAYAHVDAAQTNSIITGAIVLALASFSAYETNQAHREAGARGTSM
ncbi:MAG: SPW repeat protein [Coriobacteriia bacterium]